MATWPSGKAGVCKTPIHRFESGRRLHFSIFIIMPMRYLTIRILYPKAEHSDDILNAVKRVSDSSREFEGLVEIGAWLDKENDRIVNISLWESKEDAMKATREMHPMFFDIPWSEWERKPAENFLGLTRVV
jgi:hypothetical protein